MAKSKEEPALEVSAEGVPYQQPSRPRDEMNQPGEVTNPTKAKLETQIKELQEQVDWMNENESSD